MGRKARIRRLRHSFITLSSNPGHPALVKDFFKSDDWLDLCSEFGVDPDRVQVGLSLEDK